MLGHFGQDIHRSLRNPKMPWKRKRIFMQTNRRYGFYAPNIQQIRRNHSEPMIPNLLPKAHDRKWEPTFSITAVVRDCLIVRCGLSIAPLRAPTPGRLIKYSKSFFSMPWHSQDCGADNGPQFALQQLLSRGLLENGDLFA